MKRKTNTDRSKATCTSKQKHIPKTKTVKHSSRKSGFTHSDNTSKDGDCLQGFDISFFSHSFMIL